MSFLWGKIVMEPTCNWVAISTSFREESLIISEIDGISFMETQKQVLEKTPSSV